MSNEKRPYKGGHGKPGHSGKPGNGKFGQGNAQGEGGAKRKRRRRSGSGTGSGVSEQNRHQNQRSQNQRSQGRPQKWDDNSRNESRTGRRFDGLTSVERAARRAKTEHDDTKRGGGGTLRTLAHRRHRTRNRLRRTAIRGGIRRLREPRTAQGNS